MFCYLVYCVPCLVFEESKDFFGHQCYLQL
jgi:hypothetical protein